MWGLLGLLALLFLASPAVAQSLSDRHWVIFRRPDGLNSNDTLAISVFQEAVWVATANGISHYNGRWHSFTEALQQNAGPPTPIPLGRVTALVATADTLWAGTASGLLVRWQEAAGWQVEQTVGTAIHQLASSKSTLWIGTADGLLAYKDSAIRPVPAIGNRPVLALAAGDDLLWVGTDQTLWQLTADLTAIEVPQLHDEQGAPLQGPITALWAETPDHLWIASPTTLVEYQISNDQATSYPYPFGGDFAQITAINGNSADSIWVGSNGAGAVQFSLVDHEIASMRSWGGVAQDGLTADEVRGVALDADGSVWFATSVGVYRYQPWAFQNIDNRLDALPVYDMIFDRLGQLWTAIGDEGIQMRAGPHRPPFQYLPGTEGLPGNTLFVLEEDESGRIWAATDQGVAYFSDQRWYSPPTLRTLTMTPTSALRADALGLWIGTVNGIARFLFATQSLEFEPLLQGTPIRALEFDSVGRLWAASSTGQLWRRSIDGNWQKLSAAGGLRPDAPVTALQPETSSPGNMLAAFSGYGIYRYTNGTWAQVEKSANLGDEPIFAMFSDPATHSIWVGSETGLTWVGLNDVIRFDSQDGLQSGAIRAIARDPDGVYWFGGDRGLAYYIPERGTPWIQLATATGTRADAEQKTWLATTDLPVEFTFAYGDLQTSPARLQIFIRIRDSSPNVPPWQPITGGSHHVTFPTPGSYRLEYMVRDQAFNHSAIGAVPLTVTPAPIYLTIPLLGQMETQAFQLLVVFSLLTFFGFGFVSFEIWQHRRRVGEAIKRGYNPYISGEPVRRGEMFFGRHALLQRIVSTLHNNSIMIHGERRIGKTTLLYQLASTLRQIQDHDFWFVALYIDLEGTTESSFFHLLIEEIAHHVAALDNLDPASTATLERLLYHSLPDSLYSDREFSRDLRQILHLLEAYGAQRSPHRQLRLILLMDEMDTLSRFNHLIQQQLRRIFMREFAVSLGAVVAGVEINKEWERVESPWFNLFNEISIQPFTPQEAALLLVEPVRGYYLYEPAAMEFIVAQSEGRPYRLQQYGMEAVNEMLRHKRRRITYRDAQAAHAIIQSIPLLGQPTAAAAAPLMVSNIFPAQPSTGNG